MKRGYKQDRRCKRGASYLRAKRDAPGALKFESSFYQVDNCLTLSSAECRRITITDRRNHHRARESRNLAGEVCLRGRFQFKAGKHRQDQNGERSDLDAWNVAN